MTCSCDMHGRGKAAHCRACCVTFSGITAFDRHIVRGVHQKPAERGMVQVRPQVWGMPGSGFYGETPRQAEASL